MLRALPLCTCCRQYPGTATGITLAHSPSRISLPRQAGRVGLCNVLFEDCSAFTHVTACTLALPPKCGTLHRRLQPLRYLHDCSGCFRLELLAGWDLHPLEKRRLVTAHTLSGHEILVVCTKKGSGRNSILAMGSLSRPTSSAS